MSNNKNVIIIAEAGVNHNGDVSRAKKLIDEAANAKVDYVKFQTFKTELIISKKAPKASYQVENANDVSETQFEMAKKLEFNASQNQILINYCQAKNIKFFSTAFDLESLQFLHDIGLDVVKIPSGEITNLPYLRKAAKLFRKIILSTGMSSMNEIGEAMDIFLNSGISMKDIIVLHCNTEYPTPMKDVNLKAMISIRDRYNVAVGYSDHTLGIEVPIAAVALGASVIEKHFTLDRNLPGPDHRASLEPDELKSMVTAIRNIEDAISGDGKKRPSSSEIKNIDIARKSIHSAVELKKGSVISAEDLIPLRPGDGISPMKWDDVIGKMLVKDVPAFEKLTTSDFQ